MTFTIRIRSGGGWLSSEWLCPAHGRFEQTVLRSSMPEHVACPQCNAPSPWVVSAGSRKVPQFSVERGRPSDAPFPHATSTRELADGMSVSDWKAKRRGVWAEKTRREIKAKV